MRVIIDCDPGVDDVYALLLALCLEDVEILAITVAKGNSSLEQCVLNTQLAINLLAQKDRIASIEVIDGATSHIYGFNIQIEEMYFGSDGLADITTTTYKQEMDTIRMKHQQKLNKGHPGNKAALKMIELINKYPNEITLIAIGPLTNLAEMYNLVAVEERDDFTRKIQRLVIMGGNYPTRKKCEFIEFNFVLDITAAKIVLESFKCHIELYTMELCFKSLNMDLDSIRKEFSKYSTEQQRGVKFIREMFSSFKSLHDSKYEDNSAYFPIGQQVNEMRKDILEDGLYLKKNFSLQSETKMDISFRPCDYLAMLGALRKEELNCVSVFCSCEIQTDREEKNENGLLIVKEFSSHLDEKHNIEIVCDFDYHLPLAYLTKCMQKLQEIDIFNCQPS